MLTQPRPNYEQRIESYREEVRHLWLVEAPWMFLVGILTSLGCSYVIRRVWGWGSPMGLEWWEFGLIAAFVLMVPPILMRMPPRPELDD